MRGISNGKWIKNWVYGEDKALVDKGKELASRLKAGEVVTVSNEELFNLRDYIRYKDRGLEISYTTHIGNGSAEGEQVKTVEREVDNTVHA